MAALKKRGEYMANESVKLYMHRIRDGLKVDRDHDIFSSSRQCEILSEGRTERANI